MYNKLQYISQGVTIKEQLYNIQQALDNGCDWIQLRFKNQKAKKSFALAEAVQFLCDEYLANFIINDDVHLAEQIASDGVHLGLNDMSILQARTILGNTKIIGATANTLEDVIMHINNNCDYIGLGPFQFTKTKDNLSPILGLDGYHSIISKLNTKQKEIPIYAIGGITLENVETLMTTGIHGIAVSGIISETEEKRKLITQLNEKLYANIFV
jgi:thiamine-phosphate pyrophosphorylase